MRVKGGENESRDACVRLRFLFFYILFWLKKENRLGKFGLDLSQSGRMLHFRYFFIIFPPFFQIIKYLQNKIKSNKNLKVIIILSINQV